MVIVFLENKQIMYSFCKQRKYLHIKLGLINWKCLYLVQRSHHAPIRYKDLTISSPCFLWFVIAKTQKLTRYGSCIFRKYTT